MLPPGILAQSRARVTDLYALLPPIGIVDSNLPNFASTVAHIQAAPALGGARFVQMLLDLAPAAHTVKPIDDGLEHFFYTLAGEVELELSDGRHSLRAGSYAYLPSGVPFRFRNASGANCRVEWIKRRYEAIDGPAPAVRVGHEVDVPRLEEDVAGTSVQRLLPPDDLAFDMAVNILRFKPGVYFDYVETHIMEHGLYMLAGQGLYYLAGDLLEVQAEDFIWMAPYCPQFFYCTGWGEAAYLLYKDVNRDVPLS